MPKQRAVRVHLHGVRDQLDQVLAQLKRVKPRTPQERRYLRRKLRQLRALRVVIRTAFCPETWGVWPEKR